MNWGIWFSEAKDNAMFHDNVTGNSPQVSDNQPAANRWFDPAKKQGNYWGDHRGRDGDGDLVGDTPYAIQGPGNAVDAYPFVERDGWKRKTRQTVDHYQPAVPQPAREVRLVVAARSIALGTDGHTLLALDGRDLVVHDLLGGTRATRTVQIDDGIVAANRDGHSVLVVGPGGAGQLDLETGRVEFFAYAAEPRQLAPSYKHNHIFVGTPRGIDLLYLNLGGRRPYTIPLDGPAGAMSMNGSGTRIYTAILGQAVVDVADTEQYRVVDRIATAGEARALAVSPREDTLFVATNEGVVAIDLGTKQVRATAAFLGAVTLRTADLIPLHADPTRLLAASL